MEAEKLDVLAIGAHPDDVELGAGGTVARLVAEGKRVGIVDLTRGQLGSRGTVADRDREATEAARVLGLAVRVNLGMEDGHFTNDRGHRIPIVQMIRLYKPDILLANALSDRHPDHGKGAELVNEAAFQAGLRALKTEYKGQEQTHWRPRVIYHYVQDRYRHPDVIVDVSPYFAKKMEAVRAFASQFHNPNSDEPDTPISTPEFIHFLEARAREMGRIIGVEYGEGFNTARAPGVTDLTALL